MKERKWIWIIMWFTLGFTCKAWGVYFDAEGHYGLKPFTQTNPAFSEKKGLYQATLQSFGLLGKFKTGDNLSLNIQMRIFDDPRTAYLGDHSSPEQCASKDASERGSESSCEGRYQDTNQPGYSGYQPKFTEVYAEYGFDYCLLEAGRRSRSWGMGIFQDSGRKPFSSSYSIYDGATCKVNIQKMQALGFSVGFDKITETGRNLDIGLPDSEDSALYGPTKNSDDLDQFFFTIEYDDRQLSASDRFSRQIGIYFSNIFGSANVGDRDDKIKAKTDIKFADLYTGMFYRGFSFRNEVLFRLGKSADPTWARYGGIAHESDAAPIKNDLNAIALAGEITLRLSEDGSYVGPKEYNQGTYTSHSIFTEYAYAPGDRDGYFSQERRRELETKKVKAVGFHRNYKPALILLSDNPDLDYMRIDGVFDPSRVMNMTIYSLGYRYQSLQYGNFEAKLVTGQLNVSIPDEAKQQILEEESDRFAQDEEPEERPIGFSGKHLGYELDLGYTYLIGKDLELGGVGAAAIPGAAWRTRWNSPPEISYLLMGNATFKF